MSKPENPYAFPWRCDESTTTGDSGMTLRDWFAGQALAFVDDRYPEWQLKAWFGDRSSLTREQIRAAAAYAYADAMLAERERGQ